MSDHTTEACKILNIDTKIPATTRSKPLVTYLVFYAINRRILPINDNTFHNRIAESAYGSKTCFHVQNTIFINSAAKLCTTIREAKKQWTIACFWGEITYLGAK
jgi:hypothetical protein